MKRSLAAVGLAAAFCLVAAGCKSSGSSASSSASVPPAAASGAVSAAAVASASGSSSAEASPASSATAAAVPAAGKADKAHPCSLVTSAEVQAALGVPATITTSNVDDSIYTNCVFKSADGNHILQISTFDDTDSKSEFDQNPNHMTAVSGVGSGAFTDPDMGLLSVLQNNVLINFQLNDETSTMSAAQILTAEETIAKAAVNRL